MEAFINGVIQGFAFIMGMAAAAWCLHRYAKRKMRKAARHDEYSYGAYEMCPHGRTFAEDCYICHVKSKLKGE